MGAFRGVQGSQKRFKAISQAITTENSWIFSISSRRYFVDFPSNCFYELFLRFLKIFRCVYVYKSYLRNGASTLQNSEWCIYTTKHFYNKSSSYTLKPSEIPWNAPETPVTPFQGSWIANKTSWNIFKRSTIESLLKSLLSRWNENETVRNPLKMHLKSTEPTWNIPETPWNPSIILRFLENSWKPPWPDMFNVHY